jgi:hypothetical protein
MSSTYKFIVMPIKYRNFGVFVYDSTENQMLSAISLFIEQRKNEFDRIAKERFFPNIFLCLARVISLSGHLLGSIFSRDGFSQSMFMLCEGDITFQTPARIYF